MLTADPFFHSKHSHEGIGAGAAFNCSWQCQDAKITALMNISQLAAAGYLDAAQPHWFPCRVKTTLSPWQVTGLSPPTARQPDRRGSFTGPVSDSKSGRCERDTWLRWNTQWGESSKEQRGAFVKWTKPSGCDGLATHNYHRVKCSGLLQREQVAERGRQSARKPGEKVTDGLRTGCSQTLHRKQTEDTTEALKRATWILGTHYRTATAWHKHL